jgi:hypothetical protein
MKRFRYDRVCSLCGRMKCSHQSVRSFEEVMNHRALGWLAFLVALATVVSSCSSSDPNSGRVLYSITVTPATADAQTFPDGQVTFTASGMFSVAPSPAPLSFAAPFAGQFIVANPTNPPETIATVVSTGNSTATVQCASGATGTVSVVASAFANNGTNTVITGSAQLNCP